MEVIEFFMNKSSQFCSQERETSEVHRKICSLPIIVIVSQIRSSTVDSFVPSVLNVLQSPPALVLTARTYFCLSGTTQRRILCMIRTVPPFKIPSASRLAPRFLWIGKSTLKKKEYKEERQWENVFLPMLALSKETCFSPSDKWSHWKWDSKTGMVPGKSRSAYSESTRNVCHNSKIGHEYGRDR